MTKSRGDQKEEESGFTMARRKRRSFHELVEILLRLPVTMDVIEFVIRILRGRGRGEEDGIGDEEEELGGRRE